MNAMLLQHFGLREQPFAVTPDPRYLYESETHREALASLLYGISAERGFLALIGKPGMGKTTLLFRLLEQYRHRAATAFLFQTQCEWREFLSYLFTDLGIQCDDPNDLVTMHQRLNRMLGEQARRGRSCLVVIDEAQNLDNRALETVRLLSDFETSQTKLLQIVLAGQPAFEDKLADPAMLQLRQRISMLCRLTPLDEREVDNYIDHRLRMAGHNGTEVFTADARTRIFQLSEGIPRVISNICFNSMSLAFATQQRVVTADVVNEVGADLALQSNATTASGEPRAGAGRQARTAATVGTVDLSAAAPGDGHAAHTGPDPTPVRDKVSVPTPAGVPQPGASVSGPTGASEVAPSGTVVRRRRSAGRRRAPVLRLLERTVIAMAAAAVVVALAMWLFAHRTLGSDLLPDMASGRATVARRSGLASLQQAAATRQNGAVQQSSEASGMAPVRYEPHSVQRRDTDGERVSQHADTRQQRTVIRLTRPVVKGTAEHKLPPTISATRLSTTAALTRVPVRGTLSTFSAPRTTTEPPRILPGRVLRMVNPEYPEAARAASVQGTVTLQALVGSDGQVRNVHVVDGNPALTSAAIEAVRRWQYSPYLEDGVPLMFQTVIKIRFVLE